MSDFAAPPDRDDSSVHKKPAPWVPRADKWAEKAIPLPAWAKTFARTGKMPPENERVSNESGNTADEDAQVDADKAYSDRWRGTVREMTRLKAEAAQIIIQQKATPESPLARAAAQRGFDVDEEWARLRKDRDRGAPLVLRAFPMLTPDAVAGRALAAAERDRERSPLFAPRQDVGFDDIEL